MSKKQRTAITPTRDEDFPEWYQEVIKSADLAENSPTRGCMIIKPLGYGLWENIQAFLDNLIKEEGVENAYFPLLIPLEFMNKEAEHVDGFATECAVVTHHRLAKDAEGNLQPEGKLTEPYIVRPTSETIIADAMSRWIQSYRDLPLKLNQWGNVLRWEMRTRMFLRTAEFLWQEGHNAFANQEEAMEDAHTMLDVYAKVAEELLAVPVIKGKKTDDERFPGAVETLTIEAMMQDGKALQYGTSHYLGTTFAKSADIKFHDKDGAEKLAHTTSWGLSTRTIGGLIMVHGDDDGLRLPPRVAPTQVVVLPFLKNNEDDEKVENYCRELKQELKSIGVRVKLDMRDMRSGDKMWDHVKKGTPLRIEVGVREVDEGNVTSTRRDLGRESKQTMPKTDFVSSVQDTLEDIQNSLFNQAKEFMDSRIQDVSSIAELDTYFKTSDNVGFVRMNIQLLDDPAFEKAKQDHKITPRCLPFADKGEKVIVGKAY